MAYPKELRQRDVVVMDNLSTHKTDLVQAAFKRSAIRLLYLPPYSPDLNPIENMWSKIKTAIRHQEARNLNALMYAMAEAVDSVTQSDCVGYFANAGYNVHELF